MNKKDLTSITVVIIFIIVLLLLDTSIHYLISISNLPDWFKFWLLK